MRERERERERERVPRLDDTPFKKVCWPVLHDDIQSYFECPRNAEQFGNAKK